MLKADLHLHTNKGLLDRSNVNYSPKKLIDFMAKRGFDVVSITDHDAITYSEKLRKYARDKNIILLSGIEKTIEGKHILLININENDLKKINKFEDLKKIKRDNLLIIAPHPFFLLGSCLKKGLIKYINSFDAIEYSYFYTNLLNLNKRAVSIAEKYNKPLIGCSDAHRLWQIGTTYTLIDAKKDKKSIISAIKSKKTILKTVPMSIWAFILVSIYVCIRILLHKLNLIEE